MREPLTLLLANNKGADQPAHPRSLISGLCYLLSEKKSALVRYILILYFLYIFFVGFNMIKPLATPLDTVKFDSPLSHVKFWKLYKIFVLLSSLFLS